MKIFAAAGYLAFLELFFSYNKEDFAGLTTRSEHLIKAVTYITCHNK